jgi:hypothetical protein
MVVDEVPGDTEVRERLCWYDPRNPNSLEAVGNEIQRAPRSKGCACDPCSNGTDLLAVEILRLRELLDSQALKKALTSPAAIDADRHSHRCLNCGRTWTCPGDCQTAGGRCLACGSLIADWERQGESIDFRHQATEKGEPPTKATS